MKIVEFIANLTTMPYVTYCLTVMGPRGVGGAAQGAASTSKEPDIPSLAFEGPPVPETADAMDKIVGRFDVCQSTSLNLRDAMDKIVFPDPKQITVLSNPVNHWKNQHHQMYPN